jgi:DNA-directed RNA polymerase subunit RPC12/RpoP
MRYPYTSMHCTRELDFGGVLMSIAYSHKESDRSISCQTCSYIDNVVEVAS